ncbi:uncharacterized protein RJT21DRAFT_27937 [Scheffersomyces amazonensis]|uniref:uncharacterized protein n=1 Tax=Scheffersomyces amazonensis TaxID=1078765 RepID=UPI00315D178E
MTISPKYSLTHYYHSAKVLASSVNPVAPHVINLYLDYNCPYSGKIFFKLKDKVIPSLQQKYPNKFQFVYVNVVQPWHPNSVLLNEFSVVAAKLLREKEVSNSNELFWDISESIYKHKEEFYDTATVNLGRNEIYDYIYSIVSKDVKLPFTKEEILSQLTIEPQTELSKQSNIGNGATVDIKYFTRYLRGVGAHVTPTVSVNGIINDSISSGSEPDHLIELFAANL